MGDCGGTTAIADSVRLWGTAAGMQCLHLSEHFFFIRSFGICAIRTNSQFTLLQSCDVSLREGFELVTRKILRDHLDVWRWSHKLNKLVTSRVMSMYCKMPNDMTQLGGSHRLVPDVTRKSATSL